MTATIAERYQVVRPLGERTVDVLDLLTLARYVLVWTPRELAPGVCDVTHPNLVGIVATGVDAERGPFVVSELVHGVPLDRHLRVPVPAALARNLLAQAADAIAYLHARSLVHGGLDVRTVLVTDQLDAGRWRTVARLLDWGSADPDATPAADIHALGRLAQALLAATTRFDEATPEHAAIDRTLDRLVARARDVNELRFALEAFFGRLGVERRA
jgi:serine/threonine protein kinase